MMPYGGRTLPEPYLSRMMGAQRMFISKEHTIMNDSDLVINNYRNALRRLYGDAVADKSSMRFDHGWYYINVAKKYEDGSVGTLSCNLCKLRRKQIEERTENLNAR